MLDFFEECVPRFLKKAFVFDFALFYFAFSEKLLCIFADTFICFFGGFSSFFGCFLLFLCDFLVNVFCVYDFVFCYYTVFTNFIFWKNIVLFLLDGEVVKNKKTVCFLYKKMKLYFFVHNLQICWKLWISLSGTKNMLKTFIRKTILFRYFVVKTDKK